MERCRVLTVAGALMLLLVPVITTDALSDNEREPSPEPYSFSYQAESVGGFSSHQESGDGTGKVQGFYIIMGEDGRDRRVDYVADENGYRASVSTNEVGTRSESSADAQYNARLPSQGQLNQAKVTAEEYQYLEEQHAAERERHLANSKRQQQQQQFNFNPERQSQQQQQQWASSSGQYQSGSQSNGSRVWAANNQQGAAWNQQQQQQQQPLYGQANSTAALLNEQNSDDAWQRGARLSAGNQQQQYAANQWSSPSAPINAQSNTDQQRFSSSSWNNQTSEQRPQPLLQPNFGSLGAATTIGPLAAALANAPAPAPQRQQAQRAAWQLADRGASPARLPVNNNNNNNNYLQSALEQQFMQQAYQLTDQDYPRQPIQFNNNRQSGSVDYSSQLVTEQRPQVFANQVADVQQLQQQPQRYDNEQRANFSSVSTGYAQQRPSWQTGAYSNNNNNIGLTSTSGDYSQFNQQQNNVIDEVSGEQVDAQVSNTSDDTGKSSVSGNFTSSTQFNQDGFKQQNNYAQQQQQQQYESKRPQFVQPITTTTTTTTTSQPTAPNGFIAINLSGQENSTTLQNQQQFDQQVEVTKQPQQSFVSNTQQTTTSGFGGQKTNQDQDTGDYQQVTVAQGQQVKNPTKQVVELVNNQQQEGGSYVDSNQGTKQQQVVAVSDFQRTPELRPDTTTQGPVEPSTVQIQQQKTQQQFIETSQAPLAEITTTTTSQRPTIFQQYVTSTAPSRQPYDVSSVDTLAISNGPSSFVQQPAGPKRPATSVQYQQTIDGGVKGGNRFVGGQREFNSTFYNRFNNEQQQQPQVIVSGEQQQQQRPISEINAQVNTTASGAYQQASLTSGGQRPELIDGNRFVVGQQTNKQTEYNRLPAQQQVPYQRPSVTSFEYNNRQQQRVTGGEIGTIATTVSPIPLIATGPQQQQQYKGGVKGGSRTQGRRQFWQQQQRPLISSAQRVFQTNVTRQPAEVSPSQPSVDYAAGVTSYGSRISGR